jgi:hypothetical protein
MNRRSFIAIFSGGIASLPFIKHIYLKRKEPVTLIECSPRPKNIYEFRHPLKGPVEINGVKVWGKQRSIFSQEKVINGLMQRWNNYPGYGFSTICLAQGDCLDFKYTISHRLRKYGMYITGLAVCDNGKELYRVKINHRYVGPRELRTFNLKFECV